MRPQAIDSLAAWPADLVPPRGILVLTGYGLDVRVWRGRLRVADGIGRDRREALVHRATGRLRRLVVLGHTGYGHPRRDPLAGRRRRRLPPARRRRAGARGVRPAGHRPTRAASGPGARARHARRQRDRPPAAGREDRRPGRDPGRGRPGRGGPRRRRRRRSEPPPTRSTSPSAATSSGWPRRRPPPRTGRPGRRCR